MFVYIRSAAFVIVVTQKLVLQQSKNVTAKCIRKPSPPPSIQFSLIDNIYGRQAAKFYMKMVSFFVGNPVYTDKLGFQEFTRLFSNSSFQI